MPKTFLNDSGKYFGVKIDRNLSWKSHIEYLSVKLNRASALLFKIKNGVNSFILRTINFPIFESNLNYCLFVGLRVLTQLIVLSFYKTELLEILTFSHVTLTLVLYSEKVLFLNS